MFRKISIASATLAALTAGVFFVACRSNTSPVSSGGSSGIIGAGSTFIYPIMARWISSFQGAHQGVQINYQSIGSGGGIQQLKKGLIDFGASDAALDDDQLKEMQPTLEIPESAEIGRASCRERV